MALQLQEGQAFPKQYILKKRILSEPRSMLFTEPWLASQTFTGDPVIIRFMTTNMNEDDWMSIDERAGKLRGLVHQKISEHLILGVENGIQYLVEPYEEHHHVLDFGNKKIWAILQQIIEALIYAHELGIAHGTLNPNEILVDPSGMIRILGFALPPKFYSAHEQEFFSAQALAGIDPSVDDDFYSLGCIIYKALTGKSWKENAELDVPLNPLLESQISKMLSEFSFERTTNLNELLISLRNHFEGNPTEIAAVNFSRPPSSSIDSTKSKRERPAIAAPQQAISVQRVLIGTLALIFFAAAIFSFLHIRVLEDLEPQITKPISKNTKEVPYVPKQELTTTPLESARFKIFQEKGEMLAQEILRRQLDLEDTGVMFWASTEYEQLNSDLERADSLFRKRQFQEALDQYQLVSTNLQELQTRAASELETQTLSGENALLEGDSKVALSAFTIATSIDKKSEILKAKLSRAENLENVKELVNQGELYERNKEFDLALKTFKKANKTDNQWTPAKEGLLRAKNSIAEKKFQAAMSRGFREISNKNYQAAKAGFKEATGIFPDSTIPKDGLLQAEQAERNDIILEHQRNAEAHLESENWQEAIKEFEAVLAIADSLEFALKGLDEAKSRRNLQETLQNFLRDPTLLQSDEGLALASKTLRQASRVKRTTEQMLNYINSLARLISTARIKIPVPITSDGKTEITIRKYAVLGKITDTVVYLIPGRYTAVGQRTGFRDVRNDFVILSGKTPPVLKIASKESVE